MSLEQEKQQLLFSIAVLERKLKIIDEELRQIDEWKLQKKLLTDYLEETQRELDAYTELIEKRGIKPKIADFFDNGTLTEIEWGYEGDIYTFGLKQDYWLINEDKYIAFGSGEEMNKESCHMGESDSCEVVPITPKSTLIKRKKWLLKQLENFN
jgi:hypothetical protein